MMKLFTVLTIFVAAIVSINRAVARSQESVEEEKQELFVSQVQESGESP